MSTATKACGIGLHLVNAPSGKARRERRRALIVPREHGAWGLLLVPMATGAGVAFHESYRIFPFLLLLTAALALLWLRTPIESLLGTSFVRVQTGEERRAVAIAIAILGVVAAIALGSLLWKGRNPGLWRIGLIAGLAFVFQASLKRLGRGWRMVSEIVGTIGLTSSAAAAYYVITGKLGATAWMLWLATLLFGGNQIHYVQLRIHTARIEGVRNKFAQGWAFLAGQVGLVLVLGTLCARGLMPWFALGAFLPLVIRGSLYFLRMPQPLVVRRLGWNELGQAVLFCVLFVAAFTLSRS